MSFRNILSVRAALLSGMGVISALTLIVVVMFMRQNALLQHLHGMVVHTHQVSELIETLSSKIKDAVLYERNYLISNDLRFLNAYNSLMKQEEILESQEPQPGFLQPIKDDIEELRALTVDNPVQQKNMATLENHIADLTAYLNETITLQKMEPEKVHTPEHAQRGKVILDDIRVLISAMEAEETHLLDLRTHADEKGAFNNTLLVLTSIAIFYIIKLLLSWLIYRQWKQTKTMELLQYKRAEEVTAARIQLQGAYDQLEILNKQIKESGQAQLRAVVDHAIDGLITIDANGLIESFNPACERIFGYKAEEVIGLNIKMLMPEPYHGQHDGYLKNYHQTGKAAIIGTTGREVTAKRKNGTIFPMDLAISSFKLYGEMHFSGILRDITKRKEAEAELLRYTKELEHSNQELDDFAYIASHDLKEPLRGLFNHASFLLEDYSTKLDDEGVRRLNRLSQLAERMEHLVNDLLYFSRLGRGDLAIQVTDPNQLILEIGQMMESFLKERNARITTPNIMPSIICDRPRITEVFRNLITNAVKYNDKPERIVEVGFLSAANAPHGQEKNIFYVKDNGIGIEPEFHQEIFRIFKRLNRDDSKESGTGVGLTFVKKIVERHKGHIWLESKTGQGTTFYFNLNQEAAENDQYTESSQPKYSVS